MPKARMNGTPSASMISSGRVGMLRWALAGFAVAPTAGVSPFAGASKGAGADADSVAVRTGTLASGGAGVVGGALAEAAAGDVGGATAGAGVAGPDLGERSCAGPHFVRQTTTANTTTASRMTSAITCQLPRRRGGCGEPPAIRPAGAVRRKRVKLAIGDPQPAGRL